VVAARPHPGAALRTDCIEEEDAADDNAVVDACLRISEGMFPQERPEQRLRVFVRRWIKGLIRESFGLQ
jgi:hypothetical protein